MQEDFLPFLTNEQGVSLKEQNGVVITNPLPSPLNEAPKGWEKNTIQFSRNNEFKGMIKSYTTPLKFFFEGAFILRYYFYTYGIESILYFIWLKMDLNFGQNMKYKGWYKGEPDFATFKDSEEEDSVEINLTEGGLYKDIQSKKNTVLEYKLDEDPDAVSIIADGMEIENNVAYILSDGLTAGNGQHCVEIQIASVEKISEVASTSQTRRHFADNADLLANDIPFHKTGNSVGDVRVRANFGVTASLAFGITPNPIAGAQLLVRAFNDAGVATNAYILDNWGGASNLYNIHHTCAFDTVLPAVPANSRLYLLMFFTLGGVIASGSGADELVFWDYDAADADYFKTTYLYKYKPTIFPAFRAYDLGNKIISRISNSKSILNSDLLSNDLNLLITCGDAIRSIEKSVIKTKLSDYHKSIDAVKCISFGVENNNARLEVRKYAYQNTQISDLGSTDKRIVYPAEQFIYNKIENGYPTTDIGEVNGKYSICNKFSYSTPYKRIDNLYDAVSIYLADPFVIEILRINLEGKKTTDNQSDNNPFFIDAEKLLNDATVNVTGTSFNALTLEGLVGLSLENGIRFKVIAGINAGSYTVKSASESGGNTDIVVYQNTVSIDTTNSLVEFRHYKLRRKVYVSMTGVPSPSTIFNVELSPKTILKNHYEWIYSSMDLMEGKKIICDTTEKNSLFERTDGLGVTIKEKEDITINAATLGQKMFRPYFINFSAMSSLNLLEQMTVSNGLGYFKIGNFKGFPIDIKTNDATLETQDYKLLMTPDNDLTTLIKR